MTEPEVGGEGVRGDCLIVFQTLILPITFITTYFIATSLDHVEKRFPYISDTGTWPPESCIFGILLCFFSLSTFLTVHIRWSIIREFAKTTVSPRLNNVSLALGMIAALGVLVVANFQETSQIIVHFVGAAMAFIIGGVYMWMQTVISWRAVHVPGFVQQVLGVRLILSFLTSISTLLIGPFAVLADDKYRGNDSKTTESGTGKWDPDLGGVDLHIASTSFEWALAGCVCLYFLTFVREFRYVYFGTPKLRIKGVANQNSRRNSKTAYGGMDNPGLE